MWIAVAFVAAMFVLNLVISWWNARSVGRVWVEARYLSLWQRIVVKAGAVMSACGFSWCYLFALGLLGGLLGWLDMDQLTLMFNIGWVVIIIAAIPACWAITFESWRQAFHERTLGGAGIALWNSYATAYNTFNMIQGLGPAFKSIGDSINKLGKGKDGWKIVVAAWFCVLAIGGGILTTMLLIRHYAAQEQLELVAARARRPEYAYGQSRW